MIYFLGVISTFLFALLEPLLVNLFGISLFYVLAISIVKKNNRLLLAALIIVFSLILDVVLKYPLGVYLISFVLALFVSKAFDLFISDEDLFQGILKNTISSFLFYISILVGSTMRISSLFSPLIFKPIVVAIISGILIAFITSQTRGSSKKSLIGIKVKTR